MEIINLDFQSISEVPLSYLFGSTGVYALWGPQAVRRPTYIGQGQILDRLVHHTKKLSPNFQGIVARTDLDCTRARAKDDAEIAEAFLIWAANYLDKGPTRNINSGCWKKMIGLSTSYGRIRINITGYDPLKKPGTQGWRLAEKKVATLNGFFREGGLWVADMDIPWRRTFC